MVRDCSSSHAPHEGVLRRGDVLGGVGSSARRRARTAAGFRTPSGLCDRWAL